MGKKAIDKQVGGAHYKDDGIQPVVFSHSRNLPFIEGNVVKYVCRHRTKHGVEDLKKAMHYIELLIELEYGTDATKTKRG